MAYDPSTLRNIEYARVSRWIRETEAGWIFFDPSGQAWHIFSDEAQELEREARRKVRRLLAVEKLMQARLINALALTVVATCSLVYAGWLYAAPASIFAILGVVVGYSVPHLASMRAYRTDLQQWRCTIGKGLQRKGRGGVPETIAAHHKRYNLFRILCIGSLLALVAHGMWGAFVGLESNPWSVIDLMLAVICVATAVPASKVNSTHIRRKWFD